MIAIIQARSSSKRFKNKVMKKIFGKPMIWYVFRSLTNLKKIKNTIIATSRNRSDDKLVSYLLENKVNVYRGDLKNVAKRMYEAAKKNNAKYFIRISGDSPFIKSSIINKAISIHEKLKPKCDLVTNTFPKTYPSGMSVEIIKTSTLKKKLKYFDEYEQEHVTQYFYNNFDKFNISNFKSRKKYKGKFSIDDKSDLKRLKKLFYNKKYK